ncbi:MAG: anti sigma factor C-terminal domain-containing protein [Clostridia bacterium]|nr:anti sigma factor C-terminal domain-containing protein [Clostridia bacterium]
MDKISCPITEDLMIAYLDGEVQEDTRHAVEDHLTDCPECQAKIKALKETPLNLSYLEAKSLSAEQEKTIVKKVISRFRWGMVTIISALILLYYGGSIFSAIVIGFSGGENFERMLFNIIRFTNPGVSLRSGGINTGPWGVNLSWEGVREIGGSSILAMTVEARGSIFGNLTFSKLEKGEPRYPKELTIIESKPKENTNHAYASKQRKQWEKLGQSFVAEGVIYFNRYLTPKEVWDITSKYDLRVTWFAIDTGVSEREAFGYPDDLAFNLETADKSLTQEELITESTKGFIKELQWLRPRIKKIKNYYGYHPNFDLDPIAEYIDKNGVRIYAILVTGPAEEINKLWQKEERVDYITPGEVRPYNW